MQFNLKALYIDVVVVMYLQCLSALPLPCLTRREMQDAGVMRIGNNRTAAEATDQAGRCQSRRTCTSALELTASSDSKSAQAGAAIVSMPTQTAGCYFKWNKSTARGRFAPYRTVATFVTAATVACRFNETSPLGSPVPQFTRLRRARGIIVKWRRA